jgi:hypothetical protein
MIPVDRVPPQRLRAAAAERAPSAIDATPVVPRARAPRLSMRWLLGLLLPLRILAVVGLTALVFHIVRKRGDVGLLVWLQLVVLAMLTWTVWLHASMLVRRIGWIRRRSAARRSGQSTPLPLARATTTELRLAAPSELGVPGRGAAGVLRIRRGAAGATWWLLLGSIVVICALFIAIVVRWMVLDLDERGLGGWFVAQVLLVGAAIFAIGWTVRCAIRSVAQPAGRRSRSHVQRFFNWLLRLLSLGRYGTRGAAPTASAPAGAWTMSILTQVGALALLATGVFGVGVAAATVEGPPAGSTDTALDWASDRDPADDVDGAGSAVIVVDDVSPTGADQPTDGASQLPPGSSAPDTSSAASGPTDATTNMSLTSTASPTSGPTTTAGAPTIPTTSLVPGTTSISNPAPISPPTTPPPPTNPPTGTTQPTTVTVTVTATTAAAPTTAAPTTATTTTNAPATAPSTTAVTTTTVKRTTTTTDPCPDGTAVDCDGDGVPNRTEALYGSDPNDPESTPEDRRFDPATCADGDDNDRDGSRDGEDPGCGGRG